MRNRNKISDVLTGLAENHQAIKATLSQALSGWAKPARHISKITCHTYTVHEYRKKKFIASDEMSTGSYEVPHCRHCHPPCPSLLCRCCCCCHCHCCCCIPSSSLSLLPSRPIIIAIVITIIITSHHRRHRCPILSSSPSPSHRCHCCCHHHCPVIVAIATMAVIDVALLLLMSRCHHHCHCQLAVVLGVLPSSPSPPLHCQLPPPCHLQFALAYGPAVAVSLL